MSVASNNSENEGDSEVSGTPKKRVNVKVIPDSFTEQRVKLIGRHIDCLLCTSPSPRDS